MSRRVVAAVTDLFWVERIKAAARTVGVRIELMPPGHGHEACEAAPVDLVLVDLEAPEALDLVRTLKADPALAAVPVVGFYPHTQVELFRAATAAGIDRALARSAFTTLLPALLTGERV